MSWTCGKASATTGRGGTRWQRSFSSKETAWRKSAVLYGMEESFPPALVDRINARGVSGRHRRASQGGRRAHGRAVRLRRDRRPHLARHSVLSLLPEERRADRHEGHQQPVLVERRRQVLQLRAGREARRRRAADRPAAAQEASRRHHRPLHAQPGVSAGLGRHLPVRRLPRVPQAARWRRLEERLQGGLARGTLRRLRRERATLHDPAGRR